MAERNAEYVSQLVKNFNDLSSALSLQKNLHPDVVGIINEFPVPHPTSFIDFIKIISQFIEKNRGESAQHYSANGRLGDLDLMSVAFDSNHLNFIGRSRSIAQMGYDTKAAISLYENEFSQDIDFSFITQEPNPNNGNVNLLVEIYTQGSKKRIEKSIKLLINTQETKIVEITSILITNKGSESGIEESIRTIKSWHDQTAFANELPPNYDAL